IHSHAFVGLDIGGSLVKATLFAPGGDVADEDSEDGISRRKRATFLKQNTRFGSTGVRDPSLAVKWRGGVFHFVNFQTARMPGALLMMQKHRLFDKGELLLSTGGGAHKFSKQLAKELQVRLCKDDELHCLLRGLNFLLRHVPDECFCFRDPTQALTSTENGDIDAEVQHVSMQGEIFPYLLVNIGSGVSILRVDSPTRVERVGGTCIGGGTYWGLMRLLLGDNVCGSFERAMELARGGDSTRVDMLVRDIYGGDYPDFDLKGDVVASAFGKLVHRHAAAAAARPHTDPADVARSLTNMIGINVAQLAYLSAMQHSVTRILFAGNFMRGNTVAMRSIAYSVHYHSRGVMRAFFLKHEGYFGAIGAWLMP
ncbi:MAG: hypothetical protein MHM6MM_007440, partial [Cercozoa sp. M6MM]